MCLNPSVKKYANYFKRKDWRYLIQPTCGPVTVRWLNKYAPVSPSDLTYLKYIC